MTHSAESDSLAAGDRVQVFNPGPLCTGRVVAVGEPGYPSHRRVRVAWDDGTEGYARYDLLRRIDG